MSEGEEYETRRYEPAVWATTTVRDVDSHEEGVMRAYALLADYFAKGNEEEKEIPMAVPVALNVSRMSRCYSRCPRRRRHWAPPCWACFFPGAGAALGGGIAGWMSRSSFTCHTPSRRGLRCMDYCMDGMPPALGSAQHASCLMGCM